MPTDFELLDAWRAGDRMAGNALFDRYFDSLFRFFRNKVSEGADDLVQQTFLACVQTRDRFRGDASFRTYLFTAARSKLYTYLDKRRREGAAVDYGVTSCADLGVSPSGIVAHNEQQRMLLTALRLLPVDLQVALELFYFEQIRGPELAQVLAVPEGTVRSRLRRGRDILRSQLQQLLESPDMVDSTMTDLESWAAALRDQVLGPASD
ncbi:MAG: sigma-70 family RNA polymerase sigma factor [Deltaproteobacteria bacterium]|nr:sigma-70 family RNA polymerase sigma factor [Deltaproteobacteria bacterium]